VDFEEILDLFDTFLYEIPDNRRGYGEKRTIAFGELEKQVYCLVYTLRGKSCRLISARRANPVFLTKSVITNPRSFTE
jgi:hypothetical protein